MKTKRKKTAAGRDKKRSSLTSRKKVSLVKTKQLGLHHFRLVGHKHTFKLIHHRHTSHLVLFIILAVIGLFIYASGSMAKVEAGSANVQVGMIVDGPPPEIGATITSPKDGDKFKDQNIIDVSGTCYINSFVIVKDNDIQVGSTTCTSEGVFSLQIQLSIGKNILTALNYDNLNQAGPATPSVTILSTKTVIKKQTGTTTTAAQLPMAISPDIPDNPSIITGISSTISSCQDYQPGKLSAGGELRIAVACIPRLFPPNTQQVMGVLVWGGSPPYAISIDFGDDAADKTKLLSMETPGYKIITLSYAIPGTYKIKFRISDKDDETAIVQTSVQVNGAKEAPISAVTNQLFGGKPWYESPVPFYLLAIAITLGFWGGDIFDRKFGARSGHIGKHARA